MGCAAPLDVFYTPDDDGVHVACSHCGYHDILNFDTTSETVAAAQRDHDNRHETKP